MAITLADTLPALAQPRPRPNIVLITGDDHSRLDCGCYGNRFVHTPNLDRLAADGMRLDRAFTVTAVCTPSRSCLMSGLYPHTNGSYGFEPMNKDVRLCPEYLAEAGYRTGCVGKLHLKPERYDAYASHITYEALEHGRDLEGYSAAVDDFLGAGGEAPIYLEVGFGYPHRPFPTPGVTIGKAKQVSDPHDPADVWVPPNLADLPAVRGELAQYYDAVRLLDDGIGRVLDLIARHGLTDNTVVIYAADHGRAFPFAKTTLYDDGLNVPFVVRWPGRIAAGSTSKAMVHFVDVLPTLLDIAGVAAPDHLQGRSFGPLLRGRTDAHRDEVFGSHTTHFYRPHCPSRSIRTEEFLYIFNLAAGNEFLSDSLVGITYDAMAHAAQHDTELNHRLHRLKFRPREELYDVRADPFQLRNLLDSSGHDAQRDQMRQRLASFMQRIDDPWLDILNQQVATNWGLPLSRAE